MLMIYNEMNYEKIKIPLFFVVGVCVCVSVNRKLNQREMIKSVRKSCVVSKSEPEKPF